MLEDISKSVYVILIAEEGARHEELLAIYKSQTFEVVRLFQDCQHF